MVKVQTIEELLEELKTPGVMGLVNNGKIEVINKVILIYSPLKELLTNFHKGNLYICQN